MAWSRHAGFFASLQRVEDRLGLEEEEQSMSMSEQQSPLVFVEQQQDPTAAATSSSGPALDFLTLSKQQHQDQETDLEEEDDIERLMALLGLSSPQDDEYHVHGAAGCDCDCSGPDGFMAKVVGVVGPKCDREKTRLDAWIHHFYSSENGCREPARVAHLLLAANGGFPFPHTVKDFLDRDAPSTHPL
ncbi:hypothetical protein PR202_gb27300 [Eleusine coracana subsp. coracana]|uniref:Uncharacterized protein n=1 Tax=Eleusine coracana subsp. coracana TaxID=191504 RepID=A0AAV5FU47_ELECO|nr:hypothetical protein QOZ80_1AG0000090 [Eleusine coracana subsp. coracana]GJN38272.1 hypothetical protein PR202_gb27300 [Eleusine coracana subsp. coracana]